VVQAWLWRGAREGGGEGGRLAWLPGLSSIRLCAYVISRTFFGTADMVLLYYAGCQGSHDAVAAHITVDLTCMVHVVTSTVLVCILVARDRWRS
jgi:hypothetical protein